MRADIKIGGYYCMINLKTLFQRIFDSSQLL